MLAGKIKTLIITSRPIFWLGPIFIYLIGTTAARTSFNLLAVWGLFFVTLPMGVIVYGLNDIADRKSDKMNMRKGSVEGNIISKNQMAFISTSVVLMALLSILPYVFLNQLVSIIPLALIVLFAYLYSFEPFRLKSRPFLDSISNGLWMLLIFLAGFSLPAHNLNDLLHFPTKIWFIVLGVFAVHALTTLLDYEVDKKIGDKTIGGFLGITMTALLCCVIFIGILLFLRPQNTVFTLYLALSALLCTLIVVKPTQKIIHSVVWTILLGFPAACLYVFLFDRAFLKLFLL